MGWRLPRSLNLLLATLPSAETKRPLETLASSRQVRERAGVRAGHAACAAEPRREGRATALRAGRPFGIWCCCAWVLCFKELSKNPSIWAPSLLPAWRGAEQMVCKQNSFG